MIKASSEVNGDHPAQSVSWNHHPPGALKIRLHVPSSELFKRKQMQVQTSVLCEPDCQKRLITRIRAGSLLQTDQTLKVLSSDAETNHFLS